MSTAWKKTTLGDVLELKRGYDLPEKDRRPGVVPVVSSSGISGAHDKAKVRAPGVVTGRYGTLGEVFFVERDFWPLNTTLYVRDFKGNDPRFVSYFLKTIDYFAYSDKAAVPGVNRNHLHEASVVWPPVEEQRRITAVLGALDDKIELNRRMNDTLEAMARALFKSWFVDFDPVRANAERRAPSGMDASIAAIFPDALEAADGEVAAPVGWRTAALSEIASTQYGFTASASKDRVGPRFLRITDINKVPWIDWSSVPYCECDPGRREQYQLRVGDIVVSRMADPGKAGIVERDVDAVFASYLVRLVVPAEYRYFAYYFLTSPQYLAYAEAVRSGSAQANMNAKVITAARFIRPPPAVAAAFAAKVSPLRSRLNVAVKESESLAELRDALLPKLLSGELRVREAERIVDRAV